MLHQRVVFVFETEERLHFPPKVLIGAGVLDKRRALFGRVLYGGPVQFFEEAPAFGRRSHRLSLHSVHHLAILVKRRSSTFEVDPVVADGGEHHFLCSGSGTNRHNVERLPICSAIMRPSGSQTIEA